MSIKNHAYWATYGAITATGTTTLMTPIGSDCVYLCYGFVNVRGATTGKAINVCAGSSTTVVWSIDATAGGLGTHRLDFGEKGMKIDSAAALYAVVDATHSVLYGFTGYTGY